jgi:hypothetical protein
MKSRVAENARMKWPTEKFDSRYYFQIFPALDFRPSDSIRFRNIFLESDERFSRELLQRSLFSNQVLFGRSKGKLRKF